MTESTMPKNVRDDAKNVLKDVMGSMRSVHHRSFTWFINRPQKWSFWIAMTAFAGCLVFAFVFVQVAWPQPRWTWWARLALLCAAVTYGSALANCVAGMVGSLRIVFPPEKIVEPVIVAFPGELALITRIAQTYEPRELAYALDRLTLVATQLRARSVLLIGALDKVGLFPLFVGAYFSLRALLREHPPTSSELTWIIGGAIALGGVYLMDSGLLRWAQRLDDACVVLKHAVQAKPSAPPSGSNGQGAQDQDHVAIVSPRAF